MSIPRWNRRDRCPTCHLGLEEISPSHPVETFGCTICHEGNGLSLDKDEAHRGMLGGSNPSRLEWSTAPAGGWRRTGPSAMRATRPWKKTRPNGSPRDHGHHDRRDHQFPGYLGGSKGFHVPLRHGGLPGRDGTMRLKPAPFFSLDQAPLGPEGAPQLTDILGNLLKFPDNTPTISGGNFVPTAICGSNGRKGPALTRRDAPAATRRMKGTGFTGAGTFRYPATVRATPPGTN